jgi:drug/metabolite transporter, DME family
VTSLARVLDGPPVRSQDAVLLVLGAALLFGTTGTAQALGPDSTTPLQVGAARLLVGGLTLAVAGLAVCGRDALTAVLRTRLGWAAAAGIAIYQPAFFLGTQRSGVAEGTLLTLGSAPLLTGALSAVVDRRLPSRPWFVGTGLALVGLVLLTVAGAGFAADPVGVAASLTSAAGYAGYTVAGGRLLTQGHRPLAVSGATFGVAGLALLPCLIGAGWLLTGEGFALAAWLGLAPTAVAYVLFFRGLSALPAATVSTLTLAEPLVATLLGVTVLDERLTGYGVAGCVFVGLGLVVLGRSASVRLAVAAESPV